LSVRAVPGAIIAGGRSVRYGSAKALARVGDRRIIDRAIEALRPVTSELVLIANDAELAEAVDLAWRADVLPSLGALGGIHAALVWAREHARPGIIAVACDMPFVSTTLLAHLVERASRAEAPDVVVPESGGRRGVEPLCAFYGTGCIAAIERAAAAGDRRMIGFHADVRVDRVPLAEVETFGHPSVIFLNVNTPEDREHAEYVARAVLREDRHA
jgi:molybdopterin-guanine dinucleotide biosynthesis protein A